jgi:UDP-N-acetylmuramoyl-tripeptide--D-alanyl-D-alanine ligase
VKMSLHDIRIALGAIGDLGCDEHTMPLRVQTNSRLTEKGDLFFCLQGERFDGHTFAADAVRRGALAVVAHRGVEGVSGAPVLLVGDTLDALGRLAARHRVLGRSKVVGVTGTAGKTTVKEMLAAILSRVGPTAKNQGNFNNRVGLPLSMLKASGREDFWVMEAGISLPGEMDALAGVLSPDLAVIVNVGPAHLEGLGSVAGVAEAKTRLLAHLAEGGTGLVNLDYPELVEAATRELPGVQGFTCRDFKEAPDAVGGCVFLGPEKQGGRFLLRLGSEEMEATLPWREAFAAENIAAAACAAHLLGVQAETILQGLREVPVHDRRFQQREVGNWLLVDDTYNANPLSMAGALTAASDLAGDTPLVLVLGEMGELGSEAVVRHEELGRNIALTKVAAVFWRGDFGDDVRKGLDAGGWPEKWAGKWATTDSPEEFVRQWRDLALPGGVALFKGSRSNRMEDYVAALSRELADAV